MKEVADDVWVLPSFPPNSINAWVAGDLLFDAQTRRDGKKIVKRARPTNVDGPRAHPRAPRPPGRLAPRLHASSGIPYWVGEHDAAAAENPS